LARVLSIFFVLFLAYYVSKHLGNPYAGLGSTGELLGKSKEELEKTSGTGSFLEYLRSLILGKDVSLSYREPSLHLSLAFAGNTLLVLVPSFALAFSLALLWLYFVGLNCPKPLRALAFVPEYLYAVFFSLASWYLLWPSPLPGTGLSKALEYSFIVLLSEFPRLVHALSDTISERKEFDDVVLLWRAISLSERSVRWKVVSSMRKQVIATALTFLALSWERSAFVEPIIGFTGLGYALFNSVVRADVPLAAASFLVFYIISLVVVTISSILER